MKYNDIVSKVKEIQTPSSDYIVFKTDNNKCYYGIDSQNHVVFLIISKLKNQKTICQETKSLTFLYNKPCKFVIDGEIKKEAMHLLICREKDSEKIGAFIRLTFAFAAQDTDNDQLYLPKLFSSISTLFDKSKEVTEKELQGLFSELYVIFMFYRYGLDLSKYWQSKSRMKFDFSLSDTKRLEIKSTIKSTRIHHFRHEQLLNELYDIKIVSLMLQKNDRGLSLLDLISKIRSIFYNNYSLMLHIDAITTQLDVERMSSVRYDETYLKENIRFYCAGKIPHFSEKNPEGVFNAEYDCCLDNISGISFEQLCEWIIN